MSDVRTNVCPTDTTDADAHRRAPARSRKQKNKNIFVRMRHLEKRGLLEGKRRCRRRKRWSQHDQASPLQDGASSSHPSPPRRRSPQPSGASSASASNHSTPSSNATVNSKGCHEKPKEPASTYNPGPSVSGGLRHTTTQTSAVIPTKFLAIDCEMVGAGPKGSISQLARCSIVSYEGDVVYDRFINPPMPVTDYRTQWSGIRMRSDRLANATPYSVAQKEGGKDVDREIRCLLRRQILRLLMGKVVIGHAVHNDFKVLGYSHPSALTRDTSRIPLLNLKAGFAQNERASLKRLTKAIFNRDIQTGRKGHSSVEDARATMELYKVVEEEWERTLASRSQAS
ncbi:hypothetical protein L3Q82_012940 [Scortum barcoo]|uniref:Uncharacterized protein n=1 Tax=Scortum barcoo TaxID=214431 RepID=A0ACB8W0J4_9TELE|nr:hypothetical protein L3Q82_012940 [Scortum barcoo]